MRVALIIFFVLKSLPDSHTSVKIRKTSKGLIKLGFRTGSVWVDEREVPKHIKLVSSKFHISGSLKVIQTEYNIQPQLSEGEIAHDLITLWNYKEHESLWKPCLIDDVLCLAYVVSKHGISIQKITGVSYKSWLTESSLDWVCLGGYLRGDNKIFYTPKDKDVRDFIRKTAHGVRVNCLNRKFVSSLFDKVVNILENYYGFNIDFSDIFEKHFNYLKKIRK